MGWLGGSCAPHGIYYSGGCIQLGTSVLLHELSHSPRHLHIFVLQLASQECFPKAWQLGSKKECSRDRPKEQALLKAVLHEWYYAPLKSHCQSQTHGQGQSWYGGTTKGHEFQGACFLEGTAYHSSRPQCNHLPQLPYYSRILVIVMDLTFSGSTIWEQTWCWDCDFATTTLELCFQDSAEVRVTYWHVSPAIYPAPDSYQGLDGLHSSWPQVALMKWRGEINTFSLWKKKDIMREKKLVIVEKIQ